MYKLNLPIRGEIHFIIRIEDGACIPMNAENTDYQAYLKWLSEGNTPTQADE